MKKQFLPETFQNRKKGKDCDHYAYQHEDAWADGYCALCLILERAQLIRDTKNYRRMMVQWKEDIISDFNKRIDAMRDSCIQEIKKIKDPVNVVVCRTCNPLKGGALND